MEGNYPAGRLWKQCCRVLLTDGARKILMPIRHWLRAASKNINSKELLAFLAQAARGQSSERETQGLGCWQGKHIGIWGVQK